MKYDEQSIEKFYQDNLKKVQDAMISAFGEDPLRRIPAVNGSIYEMTIKKCLLEELELEGIKPQINGQEKIKGRERVDLLIGKVAVELKRGGMIGTVPDFKEKYSRVRSEVEAKGWVYLYVCVGREIRKHGRPADQAVWEVFGEDKAFFLDPGSGDWERFVNKVKENLS